MVAAADGLRIAFTVVDWSPPPDSARSDREAILLHGLQGNAQTQAPLAMALTADGWRVHAIDLPGHGTTRWLTADGDQIGDPGSIDPSNYALEHVAALVARAIDALDLAAPPVVIGHSYGAAVAAAMLVVGAVARHVVLIDPPLVTHQQAIAIGGQLRSELQDDPDAARALVRSWEGAWTDAEADARALALTQTSALAVDAIASGTSWTYAEMLARWAAGGAARVPLDVIAGEMEAGSMVPAMALPLLRQTLGADHVHVIAGAGHTPQRSHPEVFLSVLRSIIG